MKMVLACVGQVPAESLDAGMRLPIVESLTILSFLLVQRRVITNLLYFLWTFEVFQPLQLFGKNCPVDTGSVTELTRCSVPISDRLV